MNSKSPAPGPKPNATKQQIATQAYFLWEKGGRKAGHDLDYWLKAEQELTIANRSAPQQTPAPDQPQKPTVEIHSPKNHHAGKDNRVTRTAGALT